MTIARTPETVLSPEGILDALLVYISVTDPDDAKDCQQTIRAMRRLLDRVCARLEGGHVFH